VCRALVDQRADIGYGIKRISQLQLFYFGDDGIDEAIVNAAVDIHSLHRDAALSGKSHGVARAYRGGLVDCGVFMHDGRAVAAELKRDTTQTGSSLNFRADAR
jgi:hypothetical protein